MGDRSRGGPGPIPKRWLHCPRKSSGLIDKKFLAFKTPLDRKFDDQVPPDCVFTPELLVGTVGAYKAALGLWIDLTYTKRFYDSSRLTKKGVKYVKLECRGHGETPSEEQTKAFIQLCSQFIAQEPEKLIGVHCTHGFNRTGFMLVSYLVESEDWALDRAILEFARLRPPGIYKQDYLDELFKRYGYEGDPVPVAPALPEWCYEEDGDDEPISAPAPAQNGHQFTLSGDAQLASTPQQSAFMEGISGVTQVTEPARLKEIQNKVKFLCGASHMKNFPGSQPVSMDRENLAKLATSPYMVSWKADGMRYMMLIDGPARVFLVDRDNRVFQAPNVRFPRRKDLDAHLDNTLVDGEMVIDKVNGQSIPRYLVYDIVRFGEAEVGNTTFTVRLQCITREIIEPRAKATAEGKLNRAAEPFSVRLKDFFDLSCTERLLGEKFRQTLAHEPDGLVFQPKNERYTPGRCDSVLKWKPHYMNSVDFRLKIEKTPPKEGTVSVTRGLLYVGRMNEPFAEIPLNSELKMLNNKIVECHFDMTANCWKFMRQRTDKSFPNDKTTAYSVCNSIQYPVTQEYLLDFIRRSAYRKPVEVPRGHRS